MKRIYTNKTKREDIITSAVETLENGGILIYPTETCYGIGADATNQDAIDRLFKYKGRREGKPLSIAVKDKEMALEYVEINDIAENLYENYLPGPITVVSKGLGKVSKGVQSEFGTLGIRIPDHDLILEIIEKFGRPFTSTSANPSFGRRPYNIDSLLKELSERKTNYLDLVLDEGELPRNETSTVVDTTLNNLNVMRKGALDFSDSLKEENIILKANTKEAQSTVDFGTLVMLKHIDTILNRPLVLQLKGELGAGKTQFVKGLGRELGIDDNISSPTYTIIDEYKFELGPRKGYLVHMDTWRLDGNDEFERSGIEGYFKNNNVIAIEWADKFNDEIERLIKKYNALALKIDFEYEGIEDREIKVYTSK